MAKYTITHSCGHTETINLQGPNKERERRIAYLETIPCVECRAKKGEGMTGSVRQIAWAVDIRDAMIKCLNNVLDSEIRQYGDIATDEQIAAARASLQELVDKVNDVKDAKWFIDNRYIQDSGSSLIPAIREL